MTFTERVQWCVASVMRLHRFTKKQNAISANLASKQTALLSKANEQK